MSVSTQLKADVAHDVRGGMPGETKSWLMYEAFADQAEQNGHDDIAAVWRIISHVERYDHFYHEAELKGYVKQDMRQTLHTAIDLAQHHHQLFSQFAQQAQSGSEAAGYFTGVANDAATLGSCFQQALQDLERSRRVDRGPQVKGVKIQQSKPVTQGQARDNLNEALKTTSFAWGLYWLFARHAVSTGHPDLGVLFWDAARLEKEAHFNHAANLYGLVGDTAQNLQTSIDGETKAHQQYSDDVQQAQRAGDQHAAGFFHDAASDEAHHKEDFQILLHRLQGKS